MGLPVAAGSKSEAHTNPGLPCPDPAPPGVLTLVHLKIAVPVRNNKTTTSAVTRLTTGTPQGMSHRSWGSPSVKKHTV